MRDDAKREAYLLYGKPRPGGRTGHTAFVVLKPGKTLNGRSLNTLTNDDIDFYFSMYPDLKPAEMRGRPYTALMLKGVKQYTVNDYEADVVMRGQSWHRFEIKEREEVRVSELITTLPKKEGDSADTWREYFSKGQFHEAVQLPPHLNIDKTVASLKSIDAERQWTMFAPFPGQVANLKRYAPLAAAALFLSSLKFVSPKIAATVFTPVAALSLIPVQAEKAQNCCSAIRCSLKEGGVDITPSFSLTNTAPLQKALFWLAYAGTMYFGAKHIINSDTKFDDVLLLPAVYALARFAIAMKGAYDYYHDLRSMAKDPNDVPLKLLVPLLSGLLLVNTAFCLTSTNAARASFTYPTSLFRAAKNAKGARLVDTPAIADAPAEAAVGRKKIR